MCRSTVTKTGAVALIVIGLYSIYHRELLYLDDHIGAVSSVAMESSPTVFLRDDHDDVDKFWRFLDKHQNPSVCQSNDLVTFHHSAGLGSVLQIWKNTFLKAVQGGKILSSGFPSAYINPNICSKKTIEGCLVEPVSSCDTFSKTVKVTQHAFAKCAAFDPIEFSKRVGLSKPKGLGWFHGHSMRYLLRPLPYLANIIHAVKAKLQVDDMSTVLSVHIRHGDVGAIDHRVPIPTRKYAMMAHTVAYWNDITTVLVGSDDPNAFAVVRDYLKEMPRQDGRTVRVVEMPSDFFEVKPHEGNHHVMANLLKKIHRIEQERNGTIPVDKKKSSTIGLESGIHNNKGDEAAALLAQMFLMAESKAFIGSLNSNFGRTVYDLAGGPSSNKILIDIENRPYFGCAFGDKLPLGGANKMNPYGMSKKGD